MGLFTQSAYVLTNAAYTVDDLETVLAAFEILGTIEEPSEDHWAFGGEGLVLKGARPGSRVLVDVVDRAWKDALDDADDPVVEAVWQAGGFGPFVSPGCIERAGKQAWSWKLAPAAVRAHKAFVRLRMNWVDEDGAAQEPEERDAIEELSFLTLVAAALLADEDKAICYFNPNGESLRPPEFVHAAVEHHGLSGEAPLDVWTNLRLSRIEEGVVRMESVGMQQLGLPDVGARFPEGMFPYEEVDTFLRDIMWYMLDQGAVIGDGHVVDGPSGDWKASRIDAEGPPARPVIHFEPVMN